MSALGLVGARLRSRAYDVCYLSPHPDDVVFSCGGMIARDIAAGRRVLVVVAFAAPGPPPYSELAERVHDQWRSRLGTFTIAPADEHLARLAGRAEAPYALRLEEERRAMDALGADYAWWPFPELLYRCPSVRREDVRAPFDATADPVWAELSAAIAGLDALGAPDICAPLGIGGHRDHVLLARCAAAAQPSVSFYEEFPYAAFFPGTAVALTEGRGLVRQEVDVSGHAATKLAAVRAYASQLPVIFRDEAEFLALQPAMLTERIHRPP